MPELAMKELHLEIPGEPVPKARARKGKHGGWYTPSRTREYEELLRWHMTTARRFTGPVRVTIVFRRSSQRRADIDNLVKSVLDAANGKLWADDSQVTEVLARVERGVPSTQLSVWGLG